MFSHWVPRSRARAICLLCCAQASRKSADVSGRKREKVGRDIGCAKEWAKEGERERRGEKGREWESRPWKGRERRTREENGESEPAVPKVFLGWRPKLKLL